MQLKPLKSFAQHFARAPAREFELVQLGSGDLSLKDCWLYGNDSFVNLASSKARSSWTVLGDQDMMALMVPLSWTGDYCVNGWSSNPGDVYLLNGKHDYCNIGQDRRVLFIAFNRERLTDEIWSLSGASIAELPNAHKKLNVGTNLANELTFMVSRAFEAAMPWDQAHRQFAMTPYGECALFAELAKWLISLDLFSTGKTIQDNAAFHCVRSAREAFSATPIEKLTISEMCKAAGVGRSQLHENFVEIFKESPWQFILKRRLTSVREHLLSFEEPAASVKDSALAHGFISGGHFAKEYRKLFGELPSQTLKRAQTQVP